MWLLLACAAPRSPDGPDTPGTTEDGSDTADTGAREVLPPIGVVTVRELLVGDDRCPDGDVAAWGPYDRAPERSVYGLEWEYWGYAEAAGDDVCVGADTTGGDCIPDCASDAYCTTEGTCEPWPAHLDAGALSVGGLTTPIVLERTSVGTYALTEEPPAALFTADPVTLAAAGGADLPAFSARTPAPAPLDVAFACDPLFAPTGDVTFTWTPQGRAFRVRVLIQELAHGGGIGTVLCEGPDDGELVVPQAVLGASASAWGYSVELSRYSRGAATVGAGEVRIEAASVLRCSSVTTPC